MTARLCCSLEDAIADWLETEAGDLVPVEDRDALAEAMTIVAADKFDLLTATGDVTPCPSS